MVGTLLSEKHKWSIYMQIGTPLHKKSGKYKLQSLYYFTLHLPGTQIANVCNIKP